jgi:hypothetical protein
VGSCEPEFGQDHCDSNLKYVSVVEAGIHPLFVILFLILCGRSAGAALIFKMLLRIVAIVWGISCCLAEVKICNWYSWTTHMVNMRIVNNSRKQRLELCTLINICRKLESLSIPCSADTFSTFLKCWMNFHLLPNNQDLSTQKQAPIQRLPTSQISRSPAISSQACQSMSAPE